MTRGGAASGPGARGAGSPGAGSPDGGDRGPGAVAPDGDRESGGEARDAATPDALRALILREARSLGFHRVGIAPARPPASHGAYRDWVDAGHAGTMEYMVEPGRMAARADPRRLLAGARSIVVVALAYARERSPADATPPARDGAAAPGDGAAAAFGPASGVREPDSLDRPSAGPAPIRGVIARYARGPDYHALLHRRLRALARAVSDAIGRPVGARPCVDTAPVLERDACAAGGLGFVAKNTMLIAPGLGSYTVLGELLLDVEVTPTATEPVRQRCGSCRACLDACPTGAFADAWVLDARRCVSYLTIEHKGAIPRGLRAGVGTRIFGCDACQDACPFNAAAPDRTPPDPELSPPYATPAARGAPGAPGVDERATPDLLALLAQGSNQRKRWAEGTALRRASRDMLLRNVCVALGNAGDARAVGALSEKLADRSPLVRGHAAWALGRLRTPDAADALRDRLAREPDPWVRSEIELALVDATRHETAAQGASDSSAGRR